MAKTLHRLGEKVEELMSYRTLIAVVFTFHTLVLPLFMMVFLIQIYDGQPRRPIILSQQSPTIDQPAHTPVPLPAPSLDPSPEPALREAPAQSEWLAIAHVRRSTVEEALENLYDLNPSLRILPYERNHRPVGVKIYGVRRRSIVGAAGFRNGDVINTINGVPITTPNCFDHLMPWPPRVVEIGVTRRGRQGKVVVLIEDEPPLDSVTQVTFE